MNNLKSNLKATVGIYPFYEKSKRSGIKKYIPLIIFLLVLLILILTTYKDYGVPWDEKVFFNVGKYYTKSLFDFFHIKTNLDNAGFVPTEYHIKGHGVVSDIIVVFASLFFRIFSFETIHLIRALIAIFIFAALYLIVKKLISRSAALFSLILLLLFPRFYADMFYNAIDIPTTLFFIICTAYFINYAKTKLTFIKSAIFGLILAITINQRLILVYLIPVDFFILFLIQTGKKNLKIQSFILHLLIVCASTLLFLHLSHPYLLAHPITGIFDIVKHAKQYPWNAAVLFDGTFYQAGVNPLPWYYLPKTMLITIPLVALTLFFIGQIRLIGLIGSREKDSFKKLLYVYFLLIFYIPFILTFILKPTLYDAWRQYLFLTVPIIVIAVFGLGWMFELNFGQNKKILFVWKLVIGLLVIASLLSTAKEMITLHPYEYLFYNSLVGGLKGAYGKYETDYWGLAYKEAVIWFNKNVNDKNKIYKIWVEGDPLSSSYYFQPNMSLTQNMDEVDYIFTFTRWNFNVRHPGETIHTISREGVPLIFIKKIEK